MELYLFRASEIEIKGFSAKKEIERKGFQPCIGIFVELAGAGENNDSNFCITKDRELPGLLKQPISSFRESHLPAGGIVNSSDHYFSSPHILQSKPFSLT